MPSISVSLDQIACPGPSAGPDHSALLAAEQRAADAAHDAADDSPAPPAVMTCPMPALHAEAGAGQDAEQQGETQEYDTYAFT
jgi:hypothetical protein